MFMFVGTFVYSFIYDAFYWGVPGTRRTEKDETYITYNRYVLLAPRFFWVGDNFKNEIECSIHCM